MVFLDSNKPRCKYIKDSVTAFFASLFSLKTDVFGKCNANVRKSKILFRMEKKNIKIVYYTLLSFKREKRLQNSTDELLLQTKKKL